MSSLLLISCHCLVDVMFQSCVMSSLMSLARPCIVDVLLCLVLLCVNFPCDRVANSYTVSSLSCCCLVLNFFNQIIFFPAARKTISTAIMWKIFFDQVFAHLAYVPLTYRRIKKLRVLMINKNPRKSLSSRNGNEILNWRRNNHGTISYYCYS